MSKERKNQFYEDALGNEQKAKENIESKRCANPEDYIICRIDGLGFSKFTRAFKKPYDLVFSNAMIASAMNVMEHYAIKFAYVQSDEATFILDPESKKDFFGRRFQKISTAISNKMTSYFMLEILKSNMENKMAVLEAAPAFDGRSWAVDRLTAAKNFIWRELDARRNAATTIGSHVLGQKQIHGKNPIQIKNALSEQGFDFYSEKFVYPEHRRGALILDRPVEVRISEEILQKIPEHLREMKRQEVFIRNKLTLITDLPHFDLIENFADVLFDNQSPVLIDGPFAKHVSP